MREWYYPNNMSMVRVEGEGGSFFRNRGPSVVRLHRRYDAMLPTGQFCCEVTDVNGYGSGSEDKYHKSPFCRY